MKTFRLIFCIALVSIVWGEVASAQHRPKSTGIGLRSSYWHLRDDPRNVYYNSHRDQSRVDTGGVGGWLYLFSRIDDHRFVEFHLGAIGDVKAEREYHDREELEADAMTPVLIGIRHDLVHPRSASSLVPYFSFGGGPYWLSDIKVIEDRHDEEVEIETTLKPGGYAGGGVNFRLLDWLAFNFDIKYHFVDFNRNHSRSGYDYGIGLNIMWGHYRPGRR